MGNEMKTPVIRINQGNEAHESGRFGEGFDRRSHEGARNYQVQKPLSTKSFGYEAPTEQTKYGGY